MNRIVFRKTRLVSICRVDWRGRSLEPKDELYIIAMLMQEIMKARIRVELDDKG